MNSLMRGALLLMALSFRASSQTTDRPVSFPPSIRLPENPPISDTAKKKETQILAEAFVQEKLSIWQKRLNLPQWHITLIMASPSDLKPKTLGHLRWDADKQTAVVWVLDSLHYHMPFKEMLDEMEFTVVHELVHLSLSPLPKSEASRTVEEYIVNQITEALLKLDRKDRHIAPPESKQDSGKNNKKDGEGPKNTALLLLNIESDRYALICA